jgi:hypothetical protein
VQDKTTYMYDVPIPVWDAHREWNDTSLDAVQKVGSQGRGIPEVACLLPRLPFASQQTTERLWAVVHWLRFQRDVSGNRREACS